MTKFTPAQELAINTDAKTVVVSASAGSGKTSVMTERIVRLISQKKTTANKILAVTFTKAAAKHMKTKLISSLNKIREKGVESLEELEYLKGQIEDINDADVCTLHSFCANLLRTYFYEIGLDATFSVVDENEAQKLSDKALSELFERLYEESSPDFLLLVKTYFKNRKDDNLKKMLYSVYEFISSETEPFKVLDDALRYYTEDGLNEICSQVYEYYQYKTGKFLQAINSYAEYFEDNGMPKTFQYAQKIAKDLVVIKSTSNVFDMAKTCGLADYGRAPSEVKATDERYAVKKEFGEAKKDLLDLYAEISDFVESVSGENKTRFLQMRSLVEKFFNLLKAFVEEFTKLKREENAVDFSDLEHLTIELLKKDDVVKEINSKYEYVFVDECQDLNGAQYFIINKVSNNNLFMVGDVKQSIYAFRGCNPSLFDQKFKEALQTEGQEAIRLDKNFRSSEGVLRAVNRVFNREMTTETSTEDYAKSPMVFGELYPKGVGEAILHYYAEEKEKDKKEIFNVYDVAEDLLTICKKKKGGEGQYIADIISEEIRKKRYDAKLKREVQVSYNDIAVLTRYTTDKFSEIVDTLILNGIPVSSEDKRSIAEYPEIQFLLNVLKLVCKYDNDVALVSALKSPIGEIDETELAKIRLAFKKEKTFSQAVTQYVLCKDDQISQKLKNFKEYFDRIRLLAEYESAGEILSRIIEEKSIELYYLGMPFGEERIKRINRFIAEAGESPSCVQFLKKVDYALEKMNVAKASGGQAVRVLSMHSSKGLEFPIVILAGIGDYFVDKDKKEEIYTDRQYGIALKDYDFISRKVIKNTPLRYLMSKRMTARRTTEEMRVFYVALTRAEERLHIICKDKKTPFDDVVKVKDLYDVNTFADFLAHGDFKLAECQNKEDVLQEKKQRQVLISSFDQELSQKIYDYLSFSYPYEKEVYMPVKRSVSSVVEQNEDVYYEKTSLFGDSNTLVGSAYHKALEVIDFYGDFDKEWQKFLDDPTVMDDYKQAVDKEKLKNILSLPIFTEIDGYELYKEQSFTCYVPAKDVVGTDSESKILIQGIIDLLAVKDGQAIIVDYKYSTVKDVNDLAKKYQDQLRLYSYAVKKVLNLQVKAYIVNVNLMDQKQVE